MLLNAGKLDTSAFSDLDTMDNECWNLYRGLNVELGPICFLPQGNRSIDCWSYFLKNKTTIVQCSIMSVA